MHLRHNRTIKVKKRYLIDKIESNKKKHIKEFEEAKVAYKTEALKQLAELKEDVENGDLEIRLNLVTPIDRSSEYDKVIEMFNWDVNDEVELTQGEFNDYVHDDNDAARQASISNSFYFSR